jgi:hypothetical protein
VIAQCLFNPADLGLVSVVGQGIFKVFRTADSNLKLLPNALAKRDAQNYTCHAWMPEGSAEKERVVIGTDSGEMLVVDGGELRGVLPCDNGQGVESIATTSKGFVAGHEGGLLSIWEKIDGEERPYRRTKVFHVEGHSVKVLTRSFTFHVLLAAWDFLFNCVIGMASWPDHTLCCR